MATPLERTTRRSTRYSVMAIDPLLVNLVGTLRFAP
jgi:hypothetical protein